MSGVLLLAALLFSRGLDTGPNYDEGVYLASDDALDRGESLGEDVFSSQPPGFYLLLRFATALPGESVDADRVLFLVVAIGGVAGAWALGRALTGAAGGLLAAAALLAAPAYGTESFRVAADSPAVAIALVGLGLLAWSLRWSSTALAVCAGGAIAASVSVKLFAVTALVPAVGLLVAFRPPRRVVAGFLLGGAAVTLALLVAYAGSIGALYDDAVAFHTGAREFEGGLGENAERVATFFHPRTVFTVFVIAGAAAWLVRGARPRLLVPLWLWALASAAFLVWHRPLLDHHFVLLSAACAVAAGATLGGLTLGGLQLVASRPGGPGGRGCARRRRTRCRIRTAVAASRSSGRSESGRRRGRSSRVREHETRRHDRVRPADRRASGRAAAFGRARRHLFRAVRIRLAHSGVRPGDHGRSRRAPDGGRPDVPVRARSAGGHRSPLPDQPHGRRDRAVRALRRLGSSGAVATTWFVLLRTLLIASTDRVYELARGERMNSMLILLIVIILILALGGGLFVSKLLFLLLLLLLLLALFRGRF